MHNKNVMTRYRPIHQLTTTAPSSPGRNCCKSVRNDCFQESSNKRQTAEAGRNCLIWYYLTSEQVSGICLSDSSPISLAANHYGFKPTSAQQNVCVCVEACNWFGNRFAFVVNLRTSPVFWNKPVHVFLNKLAHVFLNKPAHVFCSLNSGWCLDCFWLLLLFFFSSSGIWSLIIAFFFFLPWFSWWYAYYIT